MATALGYSEDALPLKSKSKNNEKLRRSGIGLTLMAKEKKAERTGESNSRYPEEEKELGWR